MIVTDLFESPQPCPECGGPAFSDLILAEKKDACYSKVRSRYKVWPSAYASGALVQCRKKGAANWGNKSKNEDVAEDSDTAEDYRAKAQWLRSELHLSPDEAWERAYDTDPETWVGSPWEDDYKQGVAEAGQNFRRGNARRAAINAMSPEEQRAYDLKRQEQQRKRDEARLERERQQNAAKKGVEEATGTLARARDRLGLNAVPLQRSTDNWNDERDARHQSRLSDIERRTRYQDELDNISLDRERHRLARMKKDDDEWNDTFNAMRDRIRHRSNYQFGRENDPRLEQGVAEGSTNKDMTGQTCEKCKKGKYQERSQHDDMEGKVTCKCGHRVDRWKKYKDQGVAEGGPFSYGAKKPRQGSVADLAAKKRKQQDKNYKPTEPRDQMVGVAKVTKGVAEGADNPYGYEVGQTVKLQDGRQGQVLDIFDDSIEVLLPGGRIVTVDFQDAQVLDEAALVGGHDPSQPGPLDNFEFWQARVQHLYPDAKFIHEKGYRVDAQTGERVPGNVVAFSEQAGGEVARYSQIDREFSIKPPQAGAQKPQAQTAVQKPQAGRPQSVLNRVRTQMDQRGTVEEGFFGNMFGGTTKTAPGQLKTYAVYDGFTVYYDSAKEMFVTAGTGEYKDKFRARGFPALSAQGGVNTAIAYGEKMTGGGHQQPRSMDRSVMGGAHESVAEGETDLNWIRNASKEKLDAIAGPRYKKQSDKKDIDPNKKQQPKKGALDLATLRAAAKTARPAGDLDEGSGNIGSAIKSLYQKIYRAGDDEVEYFYNDSPIFAQYWDEYEGDIDSIVAEVDPKELQIIHDELESYVQNANLAEGKPKEREADYGGDYQDMVARVKKLAGLGPLKTVYDPQKRVYKNVPRAVQPGEKK